MTDIDDHGRPEPPITGDEIDTLLGFLDYQRATLAWKTEGLDPAAPWDTVDWQADEDWDWHSAAKDSPEQLRTMWQEAVERSRASVAEAGADGGLERLARRRWPTGESPSLRWIVVHMIEEYARHN